MKHIFQSNDKIGGKWDFHFHFICSCRADNICWRWSISSVRRSSFSSWALRKWWLSSGFTVRIDEIHTNYLPFRCVYLLSACRCESTVSWYWIYVRPKNWLILALVLGLNHTGRHDYHSAVHIYNVQAIDLSWLCLSGYGLRYATLFNTRIRILSICFFLSFFSSPKIAIGWTIFAFGLAQLPIFAFVAVVKQKGNTWTEKIAAAFRPSEKWGPSDPITFEKYQKYISQWKSDLDNEPSRSLCGRIKRKLFD